MPKYPYYTEPTHDRGGITDASGNGARDTVVSNAEGRLKLDVADKIFLLKPTMHPLVTFLTNVGKGAKSAGLLKKVAINPEFGWIEDYPNGRYAKVSGTYLASGGVTITVSGAGSSSAYIFTVGDVIMNARTGERMLVATIASATTITVASTGRAFGTTAAAAGADSDGIYIVGNANEENSGARNMNTTRSAKETNYTQIFKTTIGVSGTEDSVETYGGKDIPYLRGKYGTQHVEDIERAFWFGEKKYDTNGTQGKARRTTGGIEEFITAGNSYVQNQGGSLTAPDMNTFLREGFSHGSTTKTLFAGGQLIQAINEIARGQLQTKMDSNTYGVEISKWTTTFGTVNIVHHPFFVEDFAGSGYLLDLECFAYRYLKGRDTTLKTNVQANDLDGVVDQYITECGLERKQAPRHALLKGVVA